MKLDGFRDGIVISHLLLKFQAIVEGNTPGSTDAPTFAGIFLAGDRQSTAYTSGLSVAEALFGRMHFDEALIQHSAVLYGRGLKRLQSDLQNMEKEEIGARSYMNLWSSTFLGIYEMMTASTPMSWLEHSRGLSALVRDFSTPVTICDANKLTNRQSHSVLMLSRECLLGDYSTPTDSLLSVILLSLRDF